MIITVYNNVDNNKRRHRKMDGGEVEGRNLLVLGEWNVRIEEEQARMETQEKDKWKMKKITCEGKRILRKPDYIK